MAASREDVNRWIETAREKGDEYIISVCDNFEYDDYPVYCKDRKMVAERIPAMNGKNMQTINEIIRVPKEGPAVENLGTYDF